MQRNYTMRKQCLACPCWFTLNGSAQKFCKDDHCVSRRRKKARLEAKEAEARMRARLAAKKADVVGSDQHLARALRSGE